MDGEPTRLQGGCAFLFLFELAALGALLYLAFGAGMLMPLDCLHEEACAQGRHLAFDLLSIVFWVSLVVNIAFAVWASKNHSRPIR